MDVEKEGRWNNLSAPMTAFVSIESFLSLARLTWKAQKIWPSEDEMVMIIGIIIYYIFSL